MLLNRYPNDINAVNETLDYRLEYPLSITKAYVNAAKS